jgi:hypothetical protein
MKKNEQYFSALLTRSLIHIRQKTLNHADMYEVDILRNFTGKGFANGLEELE